MNVYRTGKKLNRTLYRNDELIGLLDCGEDAKLIVELLNAYEMAAAAASTFTSDELTKLKRAMTQASEDSAKAEPVCATCHDTHYIVIDNERTLCPRCPHPCPRCHDEQNTRFCVTTPCTCPCHEQPELSL